MGYLPKDGVSFPHSTLNLSPGAMEPWSSFLMVIRGPPFFEFGPLDLAHLLCPHVFGAFFLSLKAVASQRRSITLMACLPYSILG